MKELMADAKRRMEGALKSLEAEFASVRTGRASTHLLDRVTVPRSEERRVGKECRL